MDASSALLLVEVASPTFELQRRIEDATLFGQQIEAQYRVVRRVGERSIEHGFGMGQGMLVHCQLGGPAIESVGSLSITGRSAVGRQLAGHAVEIVCMEGLQRLGHTSVDQPAPCPADLLIGHLANAVVAEVIGVAVLLAHNATGPEFIQGVDQAQLIGRARSIAAPDR